MKNHVIRTLLLTLPGITPGEIITLGSENSEFIIDTESMRITHQNSDRESVLSGGVFFSGSSSDLIIEDSKASWSLDDDKYFITCMTDEQSVEIDILCRIEESIFPWPVTHIPENTELIFAKDSGILVSFNNSFWRDKFVESEWDTLSTMSMPVWGFLNEAGTVSWAVSTPFRNRISFTESENNAGLNMEFSHDFHRLSPERKISFRIVIDHEKAPVIPALHYREWIEKSTETRTLEQKSKIVPDVQKLKGAPHIYLWESSFLTYHDIPRKSWKPFCKNLLENSVIQENFHVEEWNALAECSQTEWPYLSLKKEITGGLNRILYSENFHSSAESEVLRVHENASYLFSLYPELMNSPETWGGTISTRMLDRIESLEIENPRLCVPGWELTALRPSVVQDAVNRGWLFGTYDSYHSIHDPSTIGTDHTWPTAQMTEDLWQQGGIMKKDGSYLRGFMGRGKKLNPLFARSFYENRIRENLKATPFNYYFIDCDAYGEVYDDYHPRHGNSLEEDAAERTRRLRWLSDELKLVTGSEGGNIYSIDGVHILEGISGPYFGWVDEEMKNRDSKYFRGAYYPPDEPAVKFKPIPIKENIISEFYDPSVRIPLFQAAFHDAVITTHHWSNDNFKYPEVQRTVQLTELLWMSPPMVHLNHSTLDKRGSILKKHLQDWSPLHRELGFSRLKGFDYLSEDRMVQQTVWEDETCILVNFSEKNFTSEEIKIDAQNFIVLGK